MSVGAENILSKILEQSYKQTELLTSIAESLNKIANPPMVKVEEKLCTNCKDFNKCKKAYDYIEKGFCEEHKPKEPK